MILRDGRYERLRFLVASTLEQAERDYAVALRRLPRWCLALDAYEDSMEEWALLLAELDAAAPDHLKSEILSWPSALPSPSPPPAAPP